MQLLLRSSTVDQTVLRETCVYVVELRWPMARWWLYENDVWLRPLRRLLALGVVCATGWMVTIAALEVQARTWPGLATSRPVPETGEAARPVPAAPPLLVRAQSPQPLEFDGTARDTLPPPALSLADRMCLARAVYHEARGEPIEGQIAVAQVVMNRLRAKRWPKTVCAVVYEGQERGEKCQFSFACTARKDLADSNQHWAQAKWIADDVAAGRVAIEDLSQATYFHTVAVKPIWRLALTPLRRIGQHVFYLDAKEPVPPARPEVGVDGDGASPAVSGPVPVDPASGRLAVHASTRVLAASEVLSASVSLPDPTSVAVPLAPSPTPTLTGRAIAARAVPHDSVDDPTPRRPLRSKAVMGAADDRPGDSRPSPQADHRAPDLGGR